MSLPKEDGRGQRLRTVRDKAAEWGVSERWIYRAVEGRGLPAFKIGRSLLLRDDLCEEWLARHLVGGVGDDGGPPG